jgi:hypothetical protein
MTRVRESGFRGGWAAANRERHMHGTRMVWFACVAAPFFLWACGEKTTGVAPDPRLCASSVGDLGSTGCIEIAGLVLGALGRPVADVTIAALPGADGGQFAYGYALTGADGRFTIRLLRIATPAPGGAGDSASMWLGTRLPPAAPRRAPTSAGSALVRAAVAPVGTIPDPADVTITLSVP